MREFDPHYSKKTISLVIIMVWGYFSSSGVSSIHLITEIITADIYINIIKEIMLPYAGNNMMLLWTFQQDNNLKH